MGMMAKGLQGGKGERCLSHARATLDCTGLSRDLTLPNPCPPGTSGRHFGNGLCRTVSRRRHIGKKLILRGGRDGRCDHETGCREPPEVERAGRTRPPETSGLQSVRK